MHTGCTCAHRPRPRQPYTAISTVVSLLLQHICHHPIRSPFPPPGVLLTTRRRTRALFCDHVTHRKLLSAPGDATWLSRIPFHSDPDESSSSADSHFPSLAIHCSAGIDLLTSSQPTRTLYQHYQFCESPVYYVLPNKTHSLETVTVYLFSLLCHQGRKTDLVEGLTRLRFTSTLVLRR